MRFKRKGITCSGKGLKKKYAGKNLHDVVAYAKTLLIHYSGHLLTGPDDIAPAGVLENF